MQITPEMERLTTGRFRKCPKCQGMLSLEFDYKSGYQKTCLNCGRVEYFGKPDNRALTRANRKLRPEGWHISEHRR